MKDIQGQIFNYKTTEQSIKEISKIEVLTEFLPFLEILSDSKTIITKSSTLIRTLKITGFDNSNISSEESVNLFNTRNLLFSLIPDNIRLNFYTLRRKLPELDEENIPFVSDHAKEISKKWNSQFKNSFITEIYVTISCHFPNLLNDIKKLQVELHASRKNLDSQVSQIKSLLNKFAPIDVDNICNNELFKFFSYLVNCYEFNSKSQTNLFSEFSLSNITFNYDTGLIKIFNDKVKKYSKILAVRVNTNFSDDNLFRVLLTINHEFTIIQQVKTFTKEQNRKYFRVKRESLDQLPKFNAIQSRINELDEANEAIESNQTNFLNYSCYIEVFADSENELDDAVDEIHNALANEGVTSYSETVGVLLTHFAMLPDMEKLLETFQTSARARITTQNVADFISLSSTKEGFRRCPFGEHPVVDFKTVSNSTYSFTFHQDDITDDCSGHTMVIGGTGAGKSTLMSFLLMNCLKYQNIKILAFDSKEGLKIPVTVFSGKYITVGEDSDLKLNPMTLPDTFANRNFQGKFIEMLASGVSDEEKIIIEEVIRQNYTLEPEHRSLKTLHLAFGLEKFNKKSDRQTIAARVKKWNDPQENSNYSKFFNSPEDNLNFSSNIACFDMGDVLTTPELLAPVSSYIFHKFNQVIYENPSPHIIFIDEMQRYLNSKEFSPSIIRTIKESRKNKGIFIGCMQEASTLVDHELGDEIISNLATLIIFPNEKARTEHYIEKLGLNDSEFDFVKNCPNPRNVLIKKKDGHSVIIDTDLTIIDQYLKLFSSRDTDKKRMKLLIKEKGIGWVSEYLKEGRV